jgi:hypothetical protein
LLQADNPLCGKMFISRSACKRRYARKDDASFEAINECAIRKIAFLAARRNTIFLPTSRVERFEKLRDPPQPDYRKRSRDAETAGISLSLERQRQDRQALGRDGNRNKSAETPGTR